MSGCRLPEAQLAELDEVLLKPFTRSVFHEALDGCLGPLT